VSFPGKYSSLGQPIPVKSVSSNLGQVIIETTEDKLELALKNHLHNLEKRSMWIAPLGILLTIALTYCTTTFKTAFFKAETWEAFFLLVSLVMAGWLLYSLNALRTAKGITDLIKAIKGEA
jgi:hypothetical protein